MSKDTESTKVLIYEDEFGVKDKVKRTHSTSVECYEDTVGSAHFLTFSKSTTRASVIHAILTKDAMYYEIEDTVENGQYSHTVSALSGESHKLNYTDATVPALGGYDFLSCHNID